MKRHKSAVYGGAESLRFRIPLAKTMAESSELIGLVPKGDSNSTGPLIHLLQ